MELWMASILLGLVFAGIFTLAEIIIGTLLLPNRLGDMVMMIPLKAGKGEGHLRQAVSWLEWQRGVFPGYVAAVDLGLKEEERENCLQYCLGSGIIWTGKDQWEGLESFIEKQQRMEYNN